MIQTSKHNLGIKCHHLVTNCEHTPSTPLLNKHIVKLNLDIIVLGRNDVQLESHSQITILQRITTSAENTFRLTVRVQGFSCAMI